MNKIIKKYKKAPIFFAIILVFTILVTFIFFSKRKENNDLETEIVKEHIVPPTSTIFQNATVATNSSLFFASLKSAGLSSLLKETRPITVFIPDNKAFDKIPGYSLEQLLKPENNTTLKAILKNHIIRSVYTESDFKNGMILKSLSGKELVLSTKDGKWFINGTILIESKGNISANGVYYFINKVLTP